jgi:hypothetical protein
VEVERKLNEDPRYEGMVFVVVFPEKPEPEPPVEPPDGRPEDIS